MRTIILSLFLGFGSAFVAWASSVAIIDLMDVETVALTEHKIVILVAAVLFVVGMLMMRGSADFVISLSATVGGCAIFWGERSLPEGAGYTPEYWSAVVVTTLVFMALVATLHSDYYFRSRRSTRRRA